MPSMLKTVVLAAALAGNALAHFTLQIPTSLGFDDDKEGEGPCGSFNISNRDPKLVSDFHVDGSAISVKTGHPETKWVIKGALLNDTDNLVALVPTILETGQGEFCVPSITVPKEWAGQDGVIQVQQNGQHGALYQCAAVKFVAGTQDSVPADCKNATNLKAEFISSSTPTNDSSDHAGHGSSATQTGASAAKTSSGAGQILTSLGSLAGAAVIALLLV